MSLWYALVLGLIQGLTEFLPVSSSGHLALAQMLLPGFEQPGVVLDAMLHVGTAMAVVWYERRNLTRMLGSRAGWRLFGLLVLGTAVTAMVALPLRGVVHRAFTSGVLIGVCLMITGVVVLATRFLSSDRHGCGEHETSWRHAVLVGVAQGLAVFPGVSRSGITIATGLAGGLDRAWVARFSFLLSVPAIAGATTVEVIGAWEQLPAVGLSFWLISLLGAAVAAVSGYLALRLVIHTLSTEVFHHFAWYCLPLGLVVILVSLATALGGQG
jgi:undecaprenyl-diphosphatase